MPKRALGNLQNLGTYASGVTKKTRQQKNGKAQKENVPVRSHCFHRFQYHANSSAQPPDCNNTAEILFVNPLVNPEATILFLTTPDEDDDGNCPAGDIVSESQHLRDEDMDMDLGEDDDDIFIEVDTPVIEDELGDLSGSSDMSREGSWQPPDVVQAEAALKDLKKILKPPRTSGQGYKDPKLDAWTRKRLEAIETFLGHYTNPQSPAYDTWTTASLLTAVGKGKTTWFARNLRAIAKPYVLFRISDPVVNPYYGRQSRSRLEDQDMANEIHEYLQTIESGHVRAQDIVNYLDKPDVQSRFGMKRGVSLATAKRWLTKMEYRWTKNFKGQYMDGHERGDVVWYRQNIFLKRWMEMEDRMRTWDEKDSSSSTPNSLSDCATLQHRQTVAWHHDESVFYANDHRTSRWVHKDASPKPYTKGEGVSVMVSDYVSADYGFLRSPDGKESARVLFKLGKSRDGYFTNDDVLAQTEVAMTIASKHFPDDDHIFIFDNATTHLKRPDNALSARKMPKFPPKEGTNWGLEVMEKDPFGKMTFDSHGKPLKIKVRMSDGKFGNGSPQPLYFPDGHPRAGIFKGMKVILEERGYNVTGLRAECPKFECRKDADHCCCRRLLYNEPDFTSVKSSLELACEAKGFEVLFLPKFHCELNFIEQVWGHGKRVYKQYPPSPKEEDLLRNVVNALESVSVEQMRKYVGP